MASEITYKFQEMKDAAANINSIASEYKALGEKFSERVVAETKTWEGASKEKFMSLINGDIKQYLEVEVPKILNGFAQLLVTDAEQMENADEQVAQGIPNSIGLNG